MNKVIKYLLLLYILFIGYQKSGAQEPSISSDSSLFYRCQMNAETVVTFDVENIQDWLYVIKRIERANSGRHSSFRSSFDSDYEMILNSPFGFYSGLAEDEKSFVNHIQIIQTNYRKYHNSSLAKEAAQKKQMIEKLSAFYRSALFMPTFYGVIEKKFHGDIEKYVDFLYKKSFTNNKKKIERYVKQPSSKRILRDPGWQYSESLYKYEYWLKNHDKINRKEWKKYVFRNFRMK